MKITYVGQLPPHPGGGAVRDGKLLSDLAERGHEIAGLALVFSDRLGFEPSRLDPHVPTVRLALSGSGDAHRPAKVSQLEDQREQVLRRLSLLLCERARTSFWRTVGRRSAECLSCVDRVGSPASCCCTA